MLVKHIKLFEKFENDTSSIIESICIEYYIKNYTVNVDGSVDVNGSVNLSNRHLKLLPLKFGKVTGEFDCVNNKLTSIEGCPKEVGGIFYCYGNELITLEGAPKEVGGSFYCGNNKLITLEGCPKEVGGNFNCAHNKLTSIEGCPREVGGGFYCYNNSLKSLEGCPKEVGGKFKCSYNPISSIYDLFPDHKSFMNSLDYNYLRGTDIVFSRFKEACEEAGVTLPKKIKGYNYI